MLKHIKWFFSPSIKPYIDEYYVDLNSKIVEIQDRIQILEEENISTTNELYRIENSLDSRIDILLGKCDIII